MIWLMFAGVGAGLIVLYWASRYSEPNDKDFPDDPVLGDHPEIDPFDD